MRRPDREPVAAHRSVACRSRRPGRRRRDRRLSPTPIPQTTRPELSTGSSLADSTRHSASRRWSGSARVVATMSPESSACNSARASLKRAPRPAGSEPRARPRPAAIRAPSPITAPGSILAPSPTSTPAARIAPRISAPAPTLQPRWSADGSITARSPISLAVPITALGPSLAPEATVVRPSTITGAAISAPSAISTSSSIRLPRSSRRSPGSVSTRRSRMSQLACR